MRAYRHHPIRTGHPDEAGLKGKFHQHALESEVGNFNKLVWRCVNCDEVRTKGIYFERRCQEAPDK